MLVRTDDAKSDERNKIKILLRSQSIYAIMLPSKASYSCIWAKKPIQQPRLRSFTTLQTLNLIIHKLVVFFD